MTESWTIRKGETRSRNGLVACQNRLAAEAGAAVLSRGGNAVDAAVVTTLVLSIVEPWLSGIGGGGFMLRADGTTGVVDTLDFNVISAGNLDPEDYPLTAGRDGDWFNWPSIVGDRNLIGYSSICTPGAIAGLAEALEKFGTLTWEEALQPAIEHARRGTRLDWFTVLALAIDAAGLSRFPASSEIFLVDGRPPRAPERGVDAFLPMPAKAATLERLAKAGARDFYEGETARRIVADLQDGGSPIGAEDLASYRPRWLEPLKHGYRGLDIYAMGGLSGGPTMIDAISELDKTLPTEDPLSGKSALAFARALRRASEHRLRSLGHAGSGSCTTHVSVVDSTGTMVSLTNTLLSRFGSKVVLPQTGFLMNNGMMWFDPRKGQPNSIAPGVRPLANMCPIIATRDGRPYMALGAAGGRQIMPAVVQLLSYVACFGLSLEDAFMSPRIDASGVTIMVDRRARADVANRLSGEFPVEIVEDTLYPVNFAIPSAVMRDGDEFVAMAHPNHPWAATAEEVR
ncbi:gamma-glutamyltransferase family protein [Aliirhizobium cellulosilyticum]|uniref:Gamma-glutamyltranspeptidase/glutathione hydrolase n=1 Tax=Aliirhizobium cellulosilyticum TaxID=393664 RepID=A0A7W6V0W0_9HYPH|nr:gamma-glutamyltransferase [Rhizobium cellulosilyticum]MBB4349985.1 gamma-glutamyltranspeptidase/glutathione hydrolase [Rhizobium cellulosilyticum]MBB4413164.1 gamma-glutamyltranspeptidase/glutathione hydrolase [Rhizobium cellulosilyticum]MBB4447898.1 gamma-glutamyltranspeptidase/glutathione hydrolase [Rhizobium cellulosilyticum]